MVRRTDSIDVRLQDGITLETEALGTVHLDARRPSGEVNICSHAHTDHLPTRADHAEIVCSPLTANLGRLRRDIPGFEATTHESVHLIDSGHVDGSTAALIEDNGMRILFTGDVALRSRYGLDGFEPPEADVLILEATYGRPEYVFPPLSTIERELLDCIEKSPGPVIVYAYALGKAQRVLALLDECDIESVYTSAEVLELCHAIETHTKTVFPACELTETTPLSQDAVLVLPGRSAAPAVVDTLISEHDAITVGCSGWAIDSSYQYRRGVDRAIALSDHCGFDELVNLVVAVDPDLVYTHHGFSMELARELVRVGVDTRALRRHQTTLASFDR